MEISFSDLAGWIESNRRQGEAYIIGIDGNSATGKSTFSERLAAALEEQEVLCSIVPMDDFYAPDFHESVDDDPLYPGFHMDWIKSEVLAPLKSGRPIGFERYDKDIKGMAGWRTVPEKAVIIFEGVFANGWLFREFHDLQLWLECPRETVLDRGEERSGPGMREAWENRWLPAEDAYIAREKPRQAADIIIDGSWGERPDAFRLVEVAAGLRQSAGGLFSEKP